MKKLNLKEVEKYVNENITTFHNAKLESLSKLNLKKILRRKNPYLFKAKNITLASDLVDSILEAHLSSSEEELFGAFLEDFAIFIAGKTCDGRKSANKGIDLEFINNSCLYLVSIKSGPSWGNSSQKRKLRDDFESALKVLKQSSHRINVTPVEGICYGKVKSKFVKGYLRVMGQNFWYLISENKELYKDIVEPLGYRAKVHNDKFIEMKNSVKNNLTKVLLNDFCFNNGQLDWDKIVEFTCGNFDDPLK
jgi:hypothetical protein